MATSTSAENYQYIGGNSDGVIICPATTNKVGYYGSTPIAQRSGSAQGAVAVPASLTNATSSQSTGFGFTTTTAFNALVTWIASINALVAELRLSLVPTTGVGIIKGSA